MGALAGTLGLVGCGSDSDHNRIFLLQGSGVSSTQIEGQVLMITHGTSEVLPDTCPEETQHRARVSASVGADGRYETQLTADDFTPVSHPACPLSVYDELEVRTIRFHSTTTADAASCETFCSRQEEPLNANCVTECLGAGQLRADARAEGSDISTVSGVTTVVLPVEFTELAPIETGGGLPDLVADAVTAGDSWSLQTRDFSEDSCAMKEGCIGGPGSRRLLTFDGAILNQSVSPLIIGDPSRFQTGHYDDCHHHFHLGGSMKYELLSQDGSVVLTGQKQGFCMMDSVQARGGEAGVYTCENQGLSAGWMDVYDRSLDCQWVDVTGIPPGLYRLKLTANPDLVFEESDYSNNSAEIEVTLTEETTAETTEENA